MKTRLLAYLILLPVILLTAFFAPAFDLLVYIAWGAFAATVALVIYAFIKTKQIYKSKKIWIALTILLSVFCFVGQVRADAYTDCLAAKAADIHSNRQCTRDPCDSAEDELKTLRETRVKLGKIAKIDRTAQQQKEYDDSIKKINDLMTKCQIQPCPSISELYKEAVNDCWICNVAELFIVAGDKVATLFYDNVSKKGYALTLLAIGFFMWLLLRVLALLGSFGVTDVGKFFTDLFTKCLLVGGVAIMLHFPLKSTVDFFVSPFFIFSSIINQKLVEISDTAFSNGTLIKIDELMKDTLGGRIDCKYCDNLKNGTQSDPDRVITSVMQHNVPASKRAVPADLRNSILCSVCSIYRVTTPPVVSGQFLFCSAKQLKKSWSPGSGPKEKVYKDVDAVIVGGFLSWVFLGITAVFSFYLIDSFVRICFVLVLFPFLLVAFVFKSTRQYTKKALDVIVHAMVTYIVVSIFMVLLMQVFYAMLGPISGKIVEALINKDDAYTALHNVLAFTAIDANGDRVSGVGGGTMVVLCCIALVFLTFFMLQIMHGVISEVSGVDLTNGGGIAAARTTFGKALAVAHFGQELYSHSAGEWTNRWRKERDENGDRTGGTEDAEKDIDTVSSGMARPFESAGNTAESGINRIGDRAAEAVDTAGEQLQKSVDQGGTNAAKGLFNSSKACFAPHTLLVTGGLSAIPGILGMVAAGTVYVGTKVIVGLIFIARKTAKIVMKAATRLVSKTAKKIIRLPATLTKAIARNKYFRKTVGFMWSAAKDTVVHRNQTSWNKYLNWRRRTRRERGAF